MELRHTGNAMTNMMTLHRWTLDFKIKYIHNHSYMLAHSVGVHDIRPSYISQVSNIQYINVLQYLVPWEPAINEHVTSRMQQETH